MHSSIGLATPQARPQRRAAGGRGGGQRRSSRAGAAARSRAAENPVERIRALLSTGRAQLLIAVLLGVVVAAVTILSRPGLGAQLHAEEWTQVASADALVTYGTVNHPDPIVGGENAGFRSDTGFSVLLAEAQLATGVEWRYLVPGFGASLFMLFVLTTYVAGRAIGAGWLPGVLAIGMPATLRLFSPEIVVPVSLALVMLGAVLLAVRPTWQAAMIAGTLLVGIALLHLPTLVVAIPAVVCVAIYVASPGRPLSQRTRSAVLAISVIVPLAGFLVFAPGLRSDLVATIASGPSAGQTFVGDHVLPPQYLRVALFGIALFTALAGGLTRATLVLSAWTLALVAFQRAHEDGLVGLPGFYDRSFHFVDLSLLAIIAIGVVRVTLHFINGTGPARLRALAVPFAPAIAAAVLCTLALWNVSQVPAHQVVSADQVEQLRWIGTNLSDVDGTVLIDPISAVAVPALAGRTVFATAAGPTPSSDARLEEAYSMLAATAPPAADDLRSAGIGIVVGPAWGEASGITKVADGIFVVDESVAYRANAVP